MMKTDPSAAQTFLVLKKAFLPDLPLKIFWYFKKHPLPLPPPETLVFWRFQMVQKENIDLIWVK